MYESAVIDYEYDRIDIRLDSYSDNYSEYFKLNSLLIGLFSMEFIFKNNEPTESIGHWTRDKFSIFSKNQHIEVEYYNKKKESQNKYPCKARLEFRAKKLNIESPKDLLQLWFTRFDKLTRHFDKLQEKNNCNMLQYYPKWLEANYPKGENRNALTAFVREHQNLFFTKIQIENFCSLLGIANPQSRAKNIIQSAKIECISYNNIKTYINKIRESIIFYFNN